MLATMEQFRACAETSGKLGLSRLCTLDWLGPCRKLGMRNTAVGALHVHCAMNLRAGDCRTGAKDQHEASRTDAPRLSWNSAPDGTRLSANLAWQPCNHHHSMSCIGVMPVHALGSLNINKSLGRVWLQEVHEAAHTHMFEESWGERGMAHSIRREPQRPFKSRARKEWPPGPGKRCICASGMETTDQRDPTQQRSDDCLTTSALHVGGQPLPSQCGGTQKPKAPRSGDSADAWPLQARVMPQLGRVASWMTTRCDRKACNGMKGQMASCVEMLLFFAHRTHATSPYAGSSSGSAPSPGHCGRSASSKSRRCG